MLGFDLSRPPSATDGATVAVLLHGRGSHRGDLQALRPHLPADWVLVTPQAPHPGHPWGYGPGWAWYRYVEEDRVDTGSLDRSLGALESLFAQLPRTLGLKPGRTLVGGFSQGGTTSVAYALTHPGTVSGVINFSGFLVNAPHVHIGTAGALATPIFWGHGTRDAAVPHRLAAKGRARLLEAGASITCRDYNIGHWIDLVEIADAVAFAEGLR